MSKPHDELFKISLTPDAARQLCRAVLPAPAADLFAQASLIRQPESFVEGSLASDVLYTAQVGEDEEVFLYVLFEHQSSVDPLMAFRVLRYMTLIWGRWLRERKDEAPAKLPPIVPIVVYHGERGWNAPLRFEELVDLPPALAQAAEVVPAFRYVLDDLTATSDEAIRARQAPPVASLAWIFLRHAYDREAGIEVWQACVDLLGPLVAELQANRDFLERLVAYSLLVGLGNETQLREELRRLGGANAEEVAVTAGQKLVEQGFEQGIEQGELKGVRRILLQQIAKKLGPLPPHEQALVEGASLQQLEVWSERVLTAEGVEDVFRD